MEFYNLKLHRRTERKMGSHASDQIARVSQTLGQKSMIYAMLLQWFETFLTYEIEFVLIIAVLENSFLHTG